MAAGLSPTVRTFPLLAPIRSPSLRPRRYPKAGFEGKISAFSSQDHGVLPATPTPHFFAAVNLTSFQEIEWDVQLALQTGLWIRPVRSPRGFRVGLEYFRGHSVLTQFFRRHEHYWSAGVWLHF